MLLLVCLLTSPGLFEICSGSVAASGCLLIADSLLFAGAQMIHAMVDGFVVQHLLPPTVSVLTSSNYSMISFVLSTGLGRLTGPTLARYLIVSGGQNVYA